jgi:hypothetical protein
MQRRATDIMTALYANSTWDKIRNLTIRLSAFRLQHSLNNTEDLDWSIVMFIISEPDLAQSTRHSYLKSLSAFYRRMKCDLPLCSILASALTATGALIPLHQARPANMSQLNNLVAQAYSRHGHRIMTLYFLMSKTASRFDEVSRLEATQIVSYQQIVPSADNNYSTHELILDWRDRTKSTRRDPYRASTWTVIHHQQPLDIIVATLRQLPPGQTLVNWTSADSLAFIRSVEPELENHSVKRGVIDFLADTISFSDRDILQVLAKHKHPSQMSSTTIRYGAGPAMARQQQTQRLTARIPVALPPLALGLSAHSPPPFLVPSPQQQHHQRRYSLSSSSSNGDLLSALLTEEEDEDPMDNMPFMEQVRRGLRALHPTATSSTTTPSGTPLNSDLSSFSSVSLRPAAAAPPQQEDSGSDSDAIDNAAMERAVAAVRLADLERRQQLTGPNVDLAAFDDPTRPQSVRRRVRNLRLARQAAGVQRLPDPLYSRFSIM